MSVGSCLVVSGCVGLCRGCTYCTGLNWVVLGYVDLCRVVSDCVGVYRVPSICAGLNWECRINNFENLRVCSDQNFDSNCRLLHAVDIKLYKTTYAIETHIVEELINRFWIFNPQTLRGGGDTTPGVFPCNFFDDSNRKNLLIVSVTRDERHILAYVTSSWRDLILVLKLTKSRSRNFENLK